MHSRLLWFCPPSCPGCPLSPVILTLDPGVNVITALLHFHLAMDKSSYRIIEINIRIMSCGGESSYMEPWVASSIVEFVMVQRYCQHWLKHGAFIDFWVKIFQWRHIFYLWFWFFRRLCEGDERYRTEYRNRDVDIWEKILLNRYTGIIFKPEIFRN